MLATPWPGREAAVSTTAKSGASWRMRSARLRDVDAAGDGRHVLGDDAIVVREQKCDRAGQTRIDAKNARDATCDCLAVVERSRPLPAAGGG